MIKDPKHYFYASNGAVLQNLDDLIAYLPAAGTSFNDHVNKEKNDFSNWMSDILGEKKLAKQLQKLGTATEFLTILEKTTKTPARRKKQKKENVISAIKEAFT